MLQKFVVQDIGLSLSEKRYKKLSLGQYLFKKF